MRDVAPKLSFTYETTATSIDYLAQKLKAPKTFRCLKINNIYYNSLNLNKILIFLNIFNIIYALF